MLRVVIHLESRETGAAVISEGCWAPADHVLFYLGQGLSAATLLIRCHLLEFSLPPGRAFYDGIFHCAAAAGSTRWVRMLLLAGLRAGKEPETKWILLCRWGNTGMFYSVSLAGFKAPS